MTTCISSTDNIIDSRDVIARIEELREECGNKYVANWNMPGYMPENEGATFGDADEALEYIKDEMRSWVDQNEELTDEEARELNAQIDTCEADEDGEFGQTFQGWHYFVSVNPEFDESNMPELEALEQLQEEAEGYSSDWHHGAQLISEDHFTQYAQDLAEDCGMVDRNLKWPYTCIDWDQAAEELKQDYTAVDFDGQTYYIR